MNYYCTHLSEYVISLKEINIIINQSISNLDVMKHLHLHTQFLLEIHFINPKIKNNTFLN
jgi:hypothetical protein